MYIESFLEIYTHGYAQNTGYFARLIAAMPVRQSLQECIALLALIRLQEDCERDAA